MDLTKTQKQEIEDVARKYGLNFLVLFGSQALGKTHKESDMDIAYSSKKDLDYKKEYELSCELQRVFAFKKRIDLVNVKNASPLLLHRIAFNSQLLAEISPHSFAYFQMYAFKMFVEAKPLFRLRDKFLAKNL